MACPRLDPSIDLTVRWTILLPLLMTLRLAADPVADDLDARFHKTVGPFVQSYCVSCHKTDKAKGDFDLTVYGSLGEVAKDYRRWETLAQRIEAGEMPPEEAKTHPSSEQARQVIDWVRAVRRYEAHRNAGDPGPVFARRLSNAEYDNTIRDLTGVDMHPAKAFPVDPANQAGFDNSSETLTMTPGLVKKYLEAARDVADHLVLKPDGIEFAPHPVVADTDRDKYCVNKIVAFYHQQRTDYADYFQAAWRFEHRAALGKPKATLDDIAAEAGVSPKYLATVNALLHEPAGDVGPIAVLQAMWRELPAGDAAEARAGCERMRDFVVALRAKLVPVVPNLTSPKLGDGSQPLVLWKDRQMAANRTRYAAGAALKIASTALPTGSPAARAMAIPADAQLTSRYDAAFTRFCQTFPDAFYVSERARVFLDPKSEKDLKGRLLSAGFHNQMGYFRDDRPLYDLVLSKPDQQELDRLWQEFDVVAGVPYRQYANFLWYERAEISFVTGPEFDFVRAEDSDLLSQAKVQRFAHAYLAKITRLGGSATVVQAVNDFLREFSDREQQVQRLRKTAEPKQLQALLAFAERAYRRPMNQAERDGLTAFYRSLRSADGLSHDDALRDALVSVLMSPNFCYRLDLPRKGDGPARPLDDTALANRLSYFLWASMPDRPLLDLAAAGKLHEPTVLAAQARRMLADDRARGFAVDFTGNWLDFRRFEEHNGVDRTRFASFDNDLRSAMFEEPVRFFLDLARRNGSVLDLLYGDYTFVNAALARHYGMPIPTTGDWTRVDNAAAFGRGGLLPMAVFLTKNSPGLRTSPVKRGNWVVKRILGEHIPPPPTKVPELPTDEAKSDLPLRDALARHRADPSCAACHERFDAMGLVFEGFGPVGEARDHDLAGRPIDAKATFPGGATGSGLAGLRAYIHKSRERDFTENLCRQMLAYGLGRSLLLTDDETVDAMRDKLTADGYRFDNLVEQIVTCPQFLNKRAGPELSSTR